MEEEKGEEEGGGGRSMRKNIQRLDVGKALGTEVPC